MTVEAEVAQVSRDSSMVVHGAGAAASVWSPHGMACGTCGMAGTVMATQEQACEHSDADAVWRCGRHRTHSGGGGVSAAEGGTGVAAVADVDMGAQGSGGGVLGKRGMACDAVGARVCARVGDGDDGRVRRCARAVEDVVVDSNGSMAAAAQAAPAHVALDGGAGGCPTSVPMVAAVAAVRTPATVQTRACLAGVTEQRACGAGVGTVSQPPQSLHGDAVSVSVCVAAVGTPWPVVCAARMSTLEAVVEGGGVQHGAAAAVDATRVQIRPAALDAPEHAVRRAHKRALPAAQSTVEVCASSVPGVARRRRVGGAPRETAAATALSRPSTLIDLASLPITSVIADAGVQPRGVVRRRVPDVWGRERLLRRRTDGEPEADATDAPT